MAKRDPAKQALLDLRLKDYAAAEKAMTAKIKQDPKDWRNYLMRGTARQALKNYAGAYEDALKAGRLNPKDGWPHNLQAQALIGLGRFDDAILASTKGIELNPADAKSYAARGLAHGHKGQSAEQLADLKKAAELDPQFQAMYHEAMGYAARPGRKLAGKSRLTYRAGAMLIALLLFTYVLMRPRGSTAITAAKTILRPRAAALSEEGRIGGFKIIRELGAGGMGVVFEAVDETLQRKVALKRMHPAIAADKLGLRRFLKEARTVASLKHANIVEIHSILERTDGLYLVFEYVDGAGLDKVLKDARKLPPPQALPLIEQMASALDYAHAKGVIHQDLKPANIMVDQERVKLMDFGIARRAQTSGGTLSRAIAGTPAYMAPEQAWGQAVAASDVYSLGLCAFEMLAGSSPFKDNQEKMSPAGSKLSQALPGLPAAADAVMDKVLRPDPLERHASAGAFASELRAALNGAAS